MLTDHLDDRSKARFNDVVSRLQAAIDAGLVPNALFTEAKDVINRAFERGTEAFLDTGPRTEDRGQSVWWHAVYNADAFVHGAHNLPSAIKRANRVSGLADYTVFLTSLLFFSKMLEAAKPLIVKRGDMPKVKTAKQIAKDAKSMTCQCCGRSIFAQTGTIAHHGYERPGYGWQTASCMGAKFLPFEVSRDRLGDLIVALEGEIKNTRVTLKNIHAEKVALAFKIEVVCEPFFDSWGRQRTLKDENKFYSRAEFDAMKIEGKRTVAAHHAACEAARQNKTAYPHRSEAIQIHLSSTTYGDLKASAIRQTEERIRALTSDLNVSRERFNDWKQTHTHFDKATQNWVAR